ncbi:hypothetical protein BU17DRAFT_23255, partial [Hysterangium stoloniferum]
GGSIHNRVRPTIEVIMPSLKCGYDRVGIKLSPSGSFNNIDRPLRATVDKFSYLIQQLDMLKVLYITLVRHLEMYDPNIGGEIQV